MSGLLLDLDNQTMSSSFLGEEVPARLHQGVPRYLVVPSPVHPTNSDHTWREVSYGS